MRLSAWRGLLPVSLAILLAAAGCTAGDEGAELEFDRGGVLRVAALADPLASQDPQAEWNRAGWEIYRCCLLRTLLSYTGTPTARGGTVLHPDLAAVPPQISPDGLTWTFRIQENLRYAPPLEDTPIVAGDFIRAIQRQARQGSGYWFYYAPIEGFREFRLERANAISGLAARDRHTLVIRLTRPTGDLGYRLAMPAVAPIPPDASDGHPFGYLRHLVGSGPYMLEGSERLDPAAPVDRQRPVRGYVAGKSITLVRNPSWDPATDDLRPAYADRIEIVVGGTPEEVAAAVDRAEVDLQLDAPPPAAQVRRYQGDPDLAGRVHVHLSDEVEYIPLNVAQPPFDDAFVRRAVALALDREDLARLAGAPVSGAATAHLMADGVLGNALVGAEPLPDGDLEAAAEAMGRSRYDADGDGVCDAKACRRVEAVTADIAPYPAVAVSVLETLQRLGIRLAFRQVPPLVVARTLRHPGEHVALAVGVTWQKLYPDGATFALPLFGADAIGPDGCCNYSMLGATETDLRRFGYARRPVPDVGSAIQRCQALTGGERVRCWAGLDRVLTARIVPAIPFMSRRNVDVVSARVAGYSFDQFAAMAALDRIALAEGESNPPAGTV